MCQVRSRFGGGRIIFQMPLDDDGHSRLRGVVRPAQTVWVWLTSPPDDQTNPTWNLVRRLAVIVPLAAAVLGGAVLLVATVTPTDDDLTAPEAGNTEAATAQTPASNAEATTTQTEVITAESADSIPLPTCTFDNADLEGWDRLALRNPREPGEFREDDGTETTVEVVEGYVRSIENNMWQVVLKMSRTRQLVPPDSYYHDYDHYEGLELGSSDGRKDELWCYAQLDGFALQDGVPNEMLSGFKVTSDPASTVLTLHLHDNPQMLITR